jgi:VCBS repeat-containing protein
VNGTGTVGWHYDISDGALDFLGDDDQLTLTFTVQVNDGRGGTATQNVVITVNGTEDVQVITSGAQAGAVSEIADNAAGENTTVHHQTGAVTFTDVDLSDGETGTVTARQVTTATLANGYTLTAAQQNALLSAFTIDPATHSSVNGTGLVGWHYDISDGALDFLGDDDQLTLTFTVQVNDDQGGIVSQNVVITVNGTEDVPVVTTINNSFAELPGTNNPNTDSVSGTISFTDVDLSDRPTVTAAFSGYTYVAADGVTALSLTASQQSAILKALALGPTPPNTSSGSVAWTYSVADNALDFLAQNEKVTLTYIATVNDQQGGIVTKPITVTINGTNDAPVIKYTGSFSLDQFNTQDYGAWVEQGNDSNGAVNGSPLNGEFQVAHDPATAAGNFQIRLTDLDAESDNPDTLSRTFNLVGAGNTAKVEFDYRRDIPSGQSNDQFIVFASINGGAFTQIGQIGATGNGSFVDGSYQHFTFDLSSANAINSVVLRFSVGDDVDDGDVVYVDNVKLSYATTAGPTQTINYTENSAVGILPPQITDADHNATVHSAAVTITNHQANDLLSVTGLLPAGIIASSYNAATGVLTLQGDASLADYQNALSHILFSNTSDNPSTVDRSLTITVNDGLANSNVATTTIHVAAIDDLPFATADNVITNVFSGNSFQIPNWALLANDQDLDNALSITSVSGGGATLGGSAVTTTNSFNYTATGGSLTSTVQATVTRDTNGALGSDSNNGDDILIARANGPSNLQMMGGGGNDVLIGNNGSQIMNGGAGSDTFVFKAIADSTPAAFDTIQDFTPGTDHLDFTTIPGTTNLHQMATAGEAVAANSISWFKDGAQTIVYVNTTGGPGHVDMEIHLTGSNINLSGSDILHHT